MREVSLLPSSLRLDLLLSATGSSFSSSSDWQSVLSQAVLWACVGQAFTNTLFSRTSKYEHGYMTTLFMHMQLMQADRRRQPKYLVDTEKGNFVIVKKIMFLHFLQNINIFP